MSLVFSSILHTWNRGCWQDRASLLPSSLPHLAPSEKKLHSYSLMVRLKPSFGASAGWPEQLIAMEFTENHVETSRIAWIWAVNFLHLSSAEVPISKCFSNCLLNRRRNLTEVSHQILDNTTKTFAEFLCKGSV